MASKVLALRTLNFLRTTHLPSYVALRVLLESTNRVRLDDTLALIVSQTAVRKHPRILELKRFKAVDRGKYSYRDYCVPSPSGSLADTYALTALHASTVLRRYADVFSYRPPPYAAYGRNFEHF